jgi:hypothetical protein
MRIRRAFDCVVLGIGLTLGLSHAGRAQFAGQPDVNNLADRMADEVRRMGEDIAGDLGQTPQGQHLLQDTRELAQAVGEFHDSIRDRPDPIRARQSYSGIDASWHHLRRMLTQPGNSSPAVDRDAQRLDALDAQLHQALGLNAPPPGFYGNGPAPSGIADTQRLAHSLVDRAEALAATIQNAMAGDPNGAALAADAARLARAADAFHDAIDANQPLQAAAQAFGPVDALADRIERYVTSNPVPPQVQAAWQAFASVEVLIHQNLGLSSPQPNVPISLGSQANGGPSPLVGLADQLVEQTAAFVSVFGPTAGRVPEGPIMLADAQQLAASAANFRQDVARNLPPNQLAYEFRDVNAIWERLARRVNRIARGRIGPNIEQVQKLGGITSQIHQVLGMPGYPPSVGVGGPPPPGIP